MRLFILLALLATLLPTHAAAFQCPAPEPALHLWPMESGVGRVLQPPNAPGFWFVFQDGDPLKVKITVELDTNAAKLVWRPVEHEVKIDGAGGLIIPKTPLEPGQLWRVTLTAPGEDGRSLSVSRDITIGAKPLDPAKIKPRLIVSPQAQESLRISQRHPKEPVDRPGRAVKLTLGDEALDAYIPALIWSSTVDGHVWAPYELCGSYNLPGASWRGRAQDLVFTQCGEALELDDAQRLRYGPLTPGEHVVALRGALPGSQLAVEVSAKLRLSCPKASKRSRGE